MYRKNNSKRVRSTSQILKFFNQPVENNDKEPNETVISPAKDPVELNKEKPSELKENSLPVVVNHDRMIFNVVIGKKSTRKHKVWDDDGTLEVTGKSAVLKNSDGKILGRTSVNSAALEEGSRLYIDSKEVEIIEKLRNVEILDKVEKETVQEPPLKKLKAMPTKKFIPVGNSSKGPIRTNRLVMPCISNAKNWLEGDLELNVEEVSVDPCLANILRPHQRKGVMFLYECLIGISVSNYFGAILADEMGLGKTVQCISILWTLLKKGPYGKPVLKKVLIVTPSSLCDNWDKEFTRWLGHHRISPYVVNAKNKAKDFKSHLRSSVMIISYDMLIRCFSDIEEMSFDLIICDEGHRLKNSDIKAAKFLRSLSCKRRVLLTGTPIQNDLQEFFALIDFVNPGILGSSSEYKRYYEDPIVASRCPNAPDTVHQLGKERATELYEKTKPFILRRTQETINKYLPSKHEIIIFCRLSKKQEMLYSHVTSTWFAKADLPGNNVPHLTTITALKKICNHPDLFLNDTNEFTRNNSALFKRISNSSDIRDSSTLLYSGKISIVQTLLRNLRETNEKILLVSYYTQTLDLLQDICNSENLKFLRLDGSTAGNMRTKIVEKFNSGIQEHKVFLLSAKAGGVGLNLPGASRLVLFDSDWNPASDSQAMARIWREGQKKDVYIYRLLSTGTIEEKIFQRQISKAGLSEGIVASTSLASLKFSLTELKDLFTLVKETNSTTHDMMNCTCNANQRKRQLSDNSQVADVREYQLELKNDEVQNLTINQLLEWEHYEEPFPSNTMQDIMLAQVSKGITFMFKHSVLRS